jgi:hypothetical protein
MPSSSNRNSLPFEPKQNKTKVKKQANTDKPLVQKQDKSANNSPRIKKNNSLKSIPEEVSKRMVRRMALFSGIPTIMGISSFLIFYVIVRQDWFKIPNTAVLLISMGLFGLGVLGLSYGILSTSWDEGRIGSWWGWQEFTVNFGRLTSAWRNTRQESIDK